MRLATFNLYQYLKHPLYWYEKKNDNRYTDTGWQAKNTWIKSQLQRMQADVVGFQEVFSADELQSLTKEAGYPYFIEGEGPDQVDPTDKEIRRHPRLALASKHPIVSQQSVPVAEEAREDMNLKADFRFSRSPLAATIADPQLGDIAVVVAHLKSKRPLVEQNTYTSEPWEARATDTMKRLSRGKVASLLQRAAEAAMLYHYFAQRMAEDSRQPFILLGDLNASDRSIVLEALTMRGRVHQIGQDKADRWPDEIRSYLYDLRLTDGFSLSPDSDQSLWSHTHLFHGEPSTLDYILLSNPFHPLNHDGAFTVTDFAVLNEHLGSDGTGDRHQSDHGQVLVEIQRRDTKAAATPTAAASDGITRDEFVSLAGGVHQSSRQYSNWNAADKNEGFWAFFFDEDYGWVKSVYGRIPVSELHQKQRYSIEHIIPKGFLKHYLRARPRNVRYGATVNPFTFAPAERGINSTRNRFPFDMDGDRVVRPFRIDLNPEATGTTGLDNEMEWVIPTVTRGDIARSILYMVLVYEIDELYNRHVDTLVHWAKVDPATPWELAFNARVQRRLGIRNPLIDTPENALTLLDDERLMRSAVLRSQ